MCRSVPECRLKAEILRVSAATRVLASVMSNKLRGDVFLLLVRLDKKRYAQHANSDSVMAVVMNVSLRPRKGISKKPLARLPMILPIVLQKMWCQQFRHYVLCLSYLIVI